MICCLSCVLQQMLLNLEHECRLASGKLLQQHCRLAAGMQVSGETCITCQGNKHACMDPCECRALCKSSPGSAGKTHVLHTGAVHRGCIEVTRPKLQSLATLYGISVTMHMRQCHNSYCTLRECRHAVTASKPYLPCSRIAGNSFPWCTRLLASISIEG